MLLGDTHKNVRWPKKFKGRYKTRNGTEPEVIVAQYVRGCWTSGQKFVLEQLVFVYGL